MIWHLIEYAIYEVRDAIIKLKGWENDKEGRQKADEFIYNNGLKSILPWIGISKG